MLFPRLLAFISVLSLASVAAVLPSDEVEALRVTLDTLGKRNWNFNGEVPCNRSLDPFNVRYTNAVDCNCTSENDTDVCHVTRIYLKEQNLNGSLPPELVGLPFLRVIDLSRNFLGGTIPSEWGSMKLVNISLLANRLMGSIPKELANITTLESLILEFNQLSGTIPPELGNLPRIERLLLSSNSLTRELPQGLAKLTTLRDFRISDNDFKGSIPNFIQNWTDITKLSIQASGLTGPIPAGIASLTNLADLRISDLNGNDSAFPPFSSITNLKTLILRNCNIVGELPSYIGEMTRLETLDLSFNKLTGQIPKSFVNLKETDYIYLTGNSLTGPLPDWMKDGDNIDLSYNKFTLESSAQNCQRGSLNLFANSKGNTPGTFSCVKSNCERNYYHFHINCGGRQKIVDDKGFTYEVDSDSAGPSNFFQSNNSNWGFSSTGHFLDDDQPSAMYILTTNSSIFGENAQLYMDARLSPLSLTYYGICLVNGNYRVNLHFAEIMFTDYGTNKRLGRRVFDVYIQGIQVLKDFNIENKADGVNKAIIEPFTAFVNDNTLEIRFYWAGKGTQGIPTRGVYGPLVSAISAIHTNYTFSSGNGNSISLGAIVGIVIAVLSTVFLVLGIVWWKGRLRHNDSMQHDLRGLDLHTGSFTLGQIKAATNNFDPANKIGEGGFGPVYRGVLLDGTIIAVKQLSSKSKQGSREFVNEIGMISALQHPHLVKLYGCCVEDNQLLLVYEYLENNSLARALFGPEEHQLHLDWPMRYRICISIARGLAYLHEESRLKIVHRDIKATNVLLDKNLVPKISDFGLAKLYEEDDTHISTRIAGTFGYMAPEYAMRGHLTYKADVYSFGVVLLEIVSGRSNISIRTKEESFYLLDWANSLNAKGNLLELVDPRLESNLNQEEVMTTINVALLCTNLVATERPSMSAVVSMLVGEVGVRQYVSDSSVLVDKMNPKEKAKMEHYDHDEDITMDVLLTGSRASTSDVYSISYTD